MDRIEAERKVKILAEARVKVEIAAVVVIVANQTIKFRQWGFSVSSIKHRNK